jgi:hypothetical protein
MKTAQLCEHTHKALPIYFQRVILTVCELHLDKKKVYTDYGIRAKGREIHYFLIGKDRNE